MVVTATRLLSASLLVVFCGACFQEAQAPQVDMTSGALRLHCKPDEIEVGEVGYTIARGGATLNMGKFEIAEGKDTFSVVVGPLPVGDNYTINLQAKAVRTRSGATSDCTGEGAFSVAPKQTTVVAVTLSCGGVVQRGKGDNQCPRIDSVRVLPSDCRLGSAVALRGDAHDLDRKLSPLQFEWSAREGSLTGATQSRASYMCTSSGRKAVTLKVSDGDATCPEESVTVFVNCRVPSSGAAGATATKGSAGSKSP